MSAAKANEKSTKVFGESSSRNKASGTESGPSLGQSSASASGSGSGQFAFLRREDQQVHDLYEFEQTIGQGHYAVVKLARHKFSNEKVTYGHRSSSNSPYLP